MEIPIGAYIQRAAAHGHATESTLNWTKATQSTESTTAASDRVAGANSLGTAETHDGSTGIKEMQAKAEYYGITNGCKN